MPKLSVPLIGLAVLLAVIGALLFVNRGLERDIAERDATLIGYSMAIQVSNDALTQYEADKLTAQQKQRAASARADKITAGYIQRVTDLMAREIAPGCDAAMQALRDDAAELAQW